MNPSDITTYIKEKGYEPSKIYNITDETGPCYAVWAMKDWPKSEREPRQYFEAPSITELFYAVQSKL